MPDCALLSPEPGRRAGALFAQSNALVAAGRPREAVAPLVECLRLAPHFGAGYVNLAIILGRFGLLAQALDMAQAGLALMPDSEPAILCLANVLYDRADFAGATALYQRLLAHDPAHAGVLSSLGNCLVAMGRLPEALDLHARAVAAAPLSVEAHYSRADALLAAGEYSAGWEEYEWRFAREHAERRGFGPAWRGEPLAGRTILLHAEQGFGDTLQFVRYAPMVAARGGRVVLEVQPALVRLMGSLPGIDVIVARGDALPGFDVHCPLLSLPRAFATQLATVPGATPYLHADPGLAAAWQARLPRHCGLRVGLVWAGSAHPTAASVQVYDQRRSLGLAELAPLAGVAGVQFVSLQAGRAAEQCRPPLPGFAISDPMQGVTDFADTAALIAGLDLVISVDTSVAHLTGALGCPVWVLSRSDSCWRWLQGRDDSPWYPTLRLYRQDQPLQWAPVVTRVRDDLAAVVAKRRIAIPAE